MSVSSFDALPSVTIHPAHAGKPDFVFRKRRLAVFVDGCFWHGCPRHATKPRNNAASWRRKFVANKARDLMVNRTLRARGRRVVCIREHELLRANEARLVSRVQAALTVGE